MTKHLDMTLFLHEQGTARHGIASLRLGIWERELAIWYTDSIVYLHIISKYPTYTLLQLCSCSSILFFRRTFFFYLFRLRPCFVWH